MRRTRPRVFDKLRLVQPLAKLNHRWRADSGCARDVRLKAIRAQHSLKCSSRFAAKVHAKASFIDRHPRSQDVRVGDQHQVISTKGSDCFVIGAAIRRKKSNQSTTLRGRRRLTEFYDLPIACNAYQRLGASFTDAALKNNLACMRMDRRERPKSIDDSLQEAHFGDF